MRHGDGQVDDRLVVCGGLPDIQHGVADLNSELGLGAGKALGRVLQRDLALCLFLVLTAELCAELGDLHDLLLGATEDLLTLCHRGGVVQVDDGVLGTVDRLEGLGDDVLTGLGQHLDGHVIGDEVLLDQGAAERIFGFGCGGEADLDLLKAKAAEQLEEVKLILKAHGDDERLVAVTQVNAAPDGGLVDRIFLHPFHSHAFGGEVLLFVLVLEFHKSSLSFLYGEAFAVPEIKIAPFTQQEKPVAQKRRSSLRGTTLLGACAPTLRRARYTATR